MRKISLLFFSCFYLFTVSAQEIILGSVLPLTGASANLGIDLKNGYESYFKYWNAGEGKKLGYQVKVIAKDDKYEPTLTYRETLNVINNNKPLMFFSHVGTPTTESIKKLLESVNIPLFGVFTGAKLFREEGQKIFFHLRASYEQEINKIMTYFLEKKKEKFFLVYQSDSFGGSGKALIIKLLGQNSKKLVGEFSYKRNNSVDKQVVDKFKESQADVVFFVGTYESLSQLIKDAQNAGYKGQFAAVSFVGTRGLKESLGKSNAEVIVSQVMPNPENRNNPMVKKYQEVMRKSGFKSFDYGSFEGYLNALVFTKALEKFKKPFERNLFLKELSSYRVNIDGMTIDFNNSTQASRSDVYLVKIKNGKTIDID